MKKINIFTVLLILICFVFSACSIADDTISSHRYEDTFKIGSLGVMDNNSFEIKNVTASEDTSVLNREISSIAEDDLSSNITSSDTVSTPSSSFSTSSEEEKKEIQQEVPEGSLASEEENEPSADVPADTNEQENISEENNEEQKAPEESETIEIEVKDPLDDVAIESLWESRNFLAIFQLLVGNQKAEDAFRYIANIREDEFQELYEFVKENKFDDKELFEELMNRVSSDNKDKEGYYIFKVEQNELGEWEVVNESVFKTNTNYLITIISCAVVSLVLFVAAVWFTSNLIIKRQMRK